MYTLTIKEIQSILKNEHLLREIVTPQTWTNHLEDPDVLASPLKSLSYTSQQTDATTLFFCKGAAFKHEYLTAAVHNGTRFYVSEVV